MEKTDSQNYTSPVAQLLSYGVAEPVETKDWPDYLALGISAQDIPELIRLATDQKLLNADFEEAASSGPIHAARALGELRHEAISAVEPLLTVPTITEDSEWALEEFPYVFAQIGPDALPILNTAITDANYNIWARAMAISGLQQIAQQLPEQRATVVALLIEQMERLEKLPSFKEDDYELNSFIIESLTQLKAQEALPVIERAIKADRSDQFLTGSWEFIQYKFGLITKEELEQLEPSPSFPSFAPPVRTDLSAPSFKPALPVERKHKVGKDKTQKNKQKMIQKSKKKNRRR